MLLVKSRKKLINKLNQYVEPGKGVGNVSVCVHIKLHTIHNVYYLAISL